MQKELWCATLPLGEFNLYMDYNREFSTRGCAGLRLPLPLMKSLLAPQGDLSYLESAFIECKWAVCPTQGCSEDFVALPLSLFPRREASVPACSKAPHLI